MEPGDGQSVKIRRPSKMDSFRVLRELETSLKFSVETVLDVGVLNGTHELMTVYGDKRQILFEPIADWNKVVEEKYRRAGVDFEIVNKAVSDGDGTVLMRTQSVRAGQKITHARMIDRTGEGSVPENTREVEMISLDSYVGTNRPKPPYLLKIDVDGAEERILSGASEVLNDCAIVVIEAGPSNFLSRSDYLKSKGFRLFDVVDICYYSKRLVQFDLVFVSESIASQKNFYVYKDGFDIELWAPFL